MRPRTEPRDKDDPWAVERAWTADFEAPHYPSSWHVAVRRRLRGLACKAHINDKELGVTVDAVRWATRAPGSRRCRLVLQSDSTAAIGALLARSQLKSSDDDDALGDRKETYAGELFLMAVGALFLGFNLAPTEEMILISYQMSKWHAIVLVAISIAAMHGFVFAVEFKGGSELSEDTPWWSALFRFTLPGYAIAALIALFMLWVFGRTDGLLGGTLKKLGVMAKTGGGRHICHLALFVVAIFIVVWYLVGHKHQP